MFVSLTKRKNTCYIPAWRRLDLDARSVAKAARVGIGTLNVWVQRGLIPGMVTGARGRQRDFDLDTATNVALIAELVRLGLAVAAASMHVRYAIRRRHHKRLMLFSPTSASVRMPAVRRYDEFLMIAAPSMN